MNMCKKASIGSLVLISSLAVLACADDKDTTAAPAQQPTIETEINPDADFSQFTSFDLIDPETAIDEEPPPDFDSYQAAIEAAVIDELTRKGLTYDTGAPDLLVNPFVSVEQVSEAYSFYDAYWGWYYGYEYLWTTEVEYAEGSLLIDVIDRRERDDIADDVLVYRGVAQGLLAQDSEVIKLQLRNATHAIFADWPERPR